jgi:hypothetical protein
MGGGDDLMFKEELVTTSVSVEQKRPYASPSIQSQQVLERAALACSGVFYNSLYNLKTSVYSCGYNDS